MAAWKPPLDSPPPISLSNVKKKHGEEALDSFKKKKPEEIKKEFERLEANAITLDQMKGRCTIALKDVNLGKNRSSKSNVLPFNYNRVVLKSSPGDDGYINASLLSIAPSKSVSKFIATLGPVKGTRTDFWKMVIQEHCPVIVNLDEESGDYFPAESGRRTFGNISVVFEGTRTLENSLVLHSLKLCREEHRSVYVLHIHYPNWPADGLPKDRSVMCAIFKRLYHVSPELGPIVMHCSGGAGRTGVFCAVHNTIQRILVGEKSALELHDTLLVFRSQRYGMVRKQSQYNFCYEAIKKALDELVSKHRRRR